MPQEYLTDDVTILTDTGDAQFNAMKLKLPEKTGYALQHASAVIRHVNGNPSCMLVYLSLGSEAHSKPGEKGTKVGNRTKSPLLGVMTEAS